MASTVDPIDSMPPWDAAAYFQEIRETTVAPAAGNSVKLCKADPNRVALIFASASTFGSNTIGTKSTITGNDGIAFGGQSPPLILTFAEVGPLVHKEWWMASASGQGITVIEVFLSRWPGDDKPKGSKRGKPA